MTTVCLTNQTAEERFGARVIQSKIVFPRYIEKTKKNRLQRDTGKDRFLKQ
jgi:hypothetical protein